DRAMAVLARPHRGTCIAPGRTAVGVAVELGAPPTQLELLIDGIDVPLQADGPWNFQGESQVLGPGQHPQVGEAPVPHGLHAREVGMLCVEKWAEPAPPAFTDWPQLQGGPAHTGAASGTVAPPLAVRWSATVGTHVRGGSPVLASGRLFVPAEDLN